MDGVNDDIVALFGYLRDRLDEEEQWAYAASAPYRYAVGDPPVPAGGVHWTWVAGEDWTPVTVDPVTEYTVGGEDHYGCGINLASVEQWPTRDGRSMPAVVADTMVEVQSGPAGHIALHDPARVLRGVAATRLLLADLVAQQHFLHDGEWYGCQAVTSNPACDPNQHTLPTGRECTCGRDDDVWRRLRIIASVYDGRPDFRDEWRIPSETKETT